jgi:hypothetical protein
MADERKPNAAGERWTRQDEENLLLEISEDQRLIRLGIDPDAHPLLVMLELSKRQKAFQKERSTTPAPPGPDKSGNDPV